MKRKIGIFVDWDRTLVYTGYFYMLNPGILLEISVYSMVNFIRDVVGKKRLDRWALIYYFLSEEDKRSDKIISRIGKRLGLYIDIKLMNLIKNLSENGNYDVIIVSSSSEKIIRGVLRELEKIYGTKINVKVIASSEDKPVTPETKGDIVKRYDGLTICFSDGAPNDIEFLKNCDIPIVRPSSLYYLVGRVPKAYTARGKDFEEILKKLEEILISSNFN
jgi:phosphoserine phosphatase